MDPVRLVRTSIPIVRVLERCTQTPLRLQHIILLTTHIETGFKAHVKLPASVVVVIVGRVAQVASVVDIVGRAVQVASVVVIVGRVVQVASAAVIQRKEPMQQKKSTLMKAKTHIVIVDSRPIIIDIINNLQLLRH